MGYSCFTKEGLKLIETIKEKYNSLSEEEKVMVYVFLGILSITAIYSIGYGFGVILGLLHNRMS